MFDQNLRHWLISIALILCLAMLLLLPETAKQDFRLEPIDVSQGQWWRLWTCHFIHLNVNHCLMSAFNYIALHALFRSSVNYRLELTVIAVGSSSVGLGLYFGGFNAETYVGFSGVIYSAAVAYSVLQIKQQPLMCSVLLLYIVGKFAVELVLPEATLSTASLIEGVVVVESHWFGVLGGLIVALIGFINNAKNP